MNLQRFLAFVWKELLEFRRDRVLVFFVLYSFTVDVVIAAQGLRLSLSNAGLSVVDYDRTVASRELTGRFSQPYFSLRDAPANERRMLKRLEAGRDLMALVIPPDFQADLALGKRVSLQLFLDGSQASNASLAEAYAQQIATDMSLRAAKRHLGLSPDEEKRLPVIEAAIRVRFNPNRDEAKFQGLEEMLMIMSIFAIILPAAALTREREHGTMEQLLVSPMTAPEILLAKITSSTMIVLIGAALTVFGILIPVFQVPVRGSLALFFGCSALFVFTMSGLGLAVASVCRTMPQVAMLTIVVMAPILFLSGAWTPPEAMPGWLADATFVSPLRWFNEIAFGSFLSGATLRDLLFPIGAMTALGAGFFVLGVVRFRRALE